MIQTTYDPEADAMSSLVRPARHRRDGHCGSGAGGDAGFRRCRSGHRHRGAGRSPTHGWRRRSHTDAVSRGVGKLSHVGRCEATLRQVQPPSSAMLIDGLRGGWRHAAPESA